MKSFNLRTAFLLTASICCCLAVAKESWYLPSNFRQLTMLPVVYITGLLLCKNRGRLSLAAVSGLIAGAVFVLYIGSFGFIITGESGFRVFTTYIPTWQETWSAIGVDLVIFLVAAMLIEEFVVERLFFSKLGDE